ncbi:MAG: single-stranded-DNA-specific exonuclease RecJ [Streptococcaceae bacterium]|nr:single-stranded-DNA-specific exonuclease RecJ [Streptococcaceae bacterium]MCL2858496.1 single-stranded-DNA-specific exonuclease RecJ [Streptococcaceae bacterium]
MIKSKYDWKIIEAQPSEDFQKITKKYKLDDLASKILWQRGIREAEQVSDFLQPDLQNLHDPFELHDMEKTVSRILSAIENGERILVYGDYDADGMTAASVMKTALDELGGEVQVYLPNRFTDGYGPNKEVYEYFIKNEEINLIITVDNGVAGHEAIDFAQNHGVDVIVTDHHAMPETLPDAYAIVHPEHPESQYPFPYLAGVGVAFKVACALLEYVPTEMLDLVAIGTIADMVSLTDENRIMVYYGLKTLAQTERVGLVELMKISGVDFDAVNEETVGFQIAPRLNALGRLDDPNPAIELLTGWDEEEALDLAQMIDEKNTERRTIVEAIYQEVESMITDEPVQVLYHADWHKGVLGIVAGRLVEKYQKPFILLAEEEGVLRGSARSIEAYNIFKALDNHRQLLVAFGGHKQAAGMTIALENIESVQKALIDYIEAEKIDMSQKGQLEIFDNLSLKDISLTTIKSFEKLAPFGMGHPKPYFLVSDYQVLQSRSMGKDNSHLKLKIQQEETAVDAIYFGHGLEDIEFEQSDTQLAVYLSSNTWQGTTTVQLMVEDARAVGVELIDVRSRKISLPENAQIFIKNHLVQSHDIIEDVLVIEEAPETQEDIIALRNLISEKTIRLIYFKNKIEKSYYLTGIGTREQYAKLYKLIYQYPEFDVRHKLKNLSSHLNVPEILLVKMIQIFEELEFVAIKDGLMTVNKEAEKKEISESEIYHELKETVQMQERFALSPVKEIYEYLKENKKD